MTTVYPTSLDAFAAIPSGGNQNVQYGARTHSAYHTDESDAIEALQAKLGVGPSSQAPAAGTVMRGSATGASLWDTKLLLGAGSASAPSYSTDGDPDTGGYSVGADIWGISAGTQLVAQFKRTSAGLLGARIGSGSFSETIGGDGDLFVKRGLNVGAATGAASGEVNASAGLHLNNITGFGVIQSQAAIANNLTLQAINSANPIGLLLITNTFDGAGGLFIMSGANPVLFVAGTSATYTHTSGTASRANVFLSGGKVTIQNLLGTTVTFFCWAFTNSTAGGAQ